VVESPKNLLRQELPSLRYEQLKTNLRSTKSTYPHRVSTSFTKLTSRTEISFAVLYVSTPLAHSAVKRFPLFHGAKQRRQQIWTDKWGATSGVLCLKRSAVPLMR